MYSPFNYLQRLSIGPTGATGPQGQPSIIKRYVHHIVMGFTDTYQVRSFNITIINTDSEPYTSSAEAIAAIFNLLGYTNDLPCFAQINSGSNTYFGYRCTPDGATSLRIYYPNSTNEGYTFLSSSNTVYTFDDFVEDLAS